MKLTVDQRVPSMNRPVKDAQSFVCISKSPKMIVESFEAFLD
jgi:hypothetical protein